MPADLIVRKDMQRHDVSRLIENGKLKDIFRTRRHLPANPGVIETNALALSDASLDDNAALDGNPNVVCCLAYLFVLSRHDSGSASDRKNRQGH